MTSCPHHILRMLCKDAKGIINWTTGIIAKHGGNILDLEQHAEVDSGLFAMRLHVEGLDSKTDFQQIFNKENPYTDFKFWIDEAHKRQRVSIFVTQESVCLYELLIKQHTGELGIDVAHIISNRAALAPVAEKFDIPFHHIPIDEEKPDDQVGAIENLLKQSPVDLIILARYMRILPAPFVASRLGKIINIHHSFLPAFQGAKPYHQAWEKGVKIIGATAHYVTPKLDEGPILHQETISVTHRHSIKEMIRAGRNLERSVLLDSVRAHIEHRVVLTGSRTIVFHF